MTKPTTLPEWDNTEVNSIAPDTDHEDQGWLAPGGIPEKPPFQTFNHWQNNVWKWLQEINFDGVLKWDAVTVYEIGSYVVGTDHRLYRGLTATNQNNNPVGDPVNWFDLFAAVGITFDDSSVPFTAANVQLAIEALQDAIDVIPASNPNIVINGDMSITQRGTTFDSTTTPANNDDTYTLDRWILLSDGNDIVDISQQGSGGIDGNSSYLRMQVATISKKFGVFHPILSTNCKDIIGSVTSLSFDARVSEVARLSDIRAVVVSWDSTADTITSDIISAWGAEGANPTLVANWTEENTAASLGVTTTWANFSIENISIDTASTENVGIFLYQDNVATLDALGVRLEIANVKLERGPNSTTFVKRSNEQELCEVYYKRFDGYTATNPVSISGFATNTGEGTYTVPLLTTTRIKPTVAISAASHFAPTDGTGTVVGAFTGVSIFTPRITQDAISLTLTGSAGLTVGQGSRLAAASSSAFIEADAEL